MTDPEKGTIGQGALMEIKIILSFMVYHDVARNENRSIQNTFYSYLNNK